MGAPLGHHVPERDAMSIEDPEGERALSMQDVFFSPFGRQEATDIILPPGEVAHRPVPEDQRKGE